MDDQPPSWPGWPEEPSSALSSHHDSEEQENTMPQHKGPKNPGFQVREDSEEHCHRTLTSAERIAELAEENAWMRRDIKQLTAREQDTNQENNRRMADHDRS